jgi:DNA-binding MarR family transcriptional regulator
MAAEEVNFLDLECLLKIGPDMVLEKLGSAINASFFDASNIAGSLKQKGLIDFTANYPGPNGIVITDAGKNLINEANAKSTEPFDNLDSEIIAQLSGGKRLPNELATALNLRPKDLAMRLYKLTKQEYVSSLLRNGTVELMLTEKGFLQAKSTAPAQQVQQMQQQNAAQTKATVQGEAKQVQEMAQELQSLPKTHKNSTVIQIAVVVVLLIILLLVLFYKHII